MSAAVRQNSRVGVDGELAADTKKTTTKKTKKQPEGEERRDQPHVGRYQQLSGSPHFNHPTAKQQRHNSPLYPAITLTSK